MPNDWYVEQGTGYKGARRRYRYLGTRLYIDVVPLKLGIWISRSMVHPSYEVIASILINKLKNYVTLW